MSKNKQLVIIGAGGHGRVAADIAELIGYTEVLFLDDNLANDPAIAGSTADISKYTSKADFFVAIGNSLTREKFFNILKEEGATLASLIHPQATVSRSARLGRGVLVAPQGVVGVNAVLGDGAIVNTLASVDHDCCLGDFSHVSAGVHMAGGTKIESHTFVGVGATVIKNVCSHCTIGAGAVVVKDITEKGTYVGVPAKRIV